jgi:hypothetical protein
MLAGGVFIFAPKTTYFCGTISIKQCYIRKRFGTAAGTEIKDARTQ